MELQSFIRKALSETKEHASNRKYLDAIFTGFIQPMQQNQLISGIIGFGSYFTSKRSPGDIDLLLKLNIAFSNENVPTLLELSNIIETEKEKHPKPDGGYYLNIFLKDINNSVIDSVDLWYIQQNPEFEKIEDIIKGRRYMIKWGSRGTEIQDSNPPISVEN